MTRSIFSDTVSDARRRQILREYGFTPRAEAAFSDHKDAILKRPPTPYAETPPELKVERMDALERRLKANKTG